MEVDKVSVGGDPMTDSISSWLFNAARDKLGNYESLDPTSTIWNLEIIGHD